MSSPCWREWTEHLSSSGGWWRWWGGGEGVGGAEPQALLCCRTLAPPGWKDASRLGIKPWPWSRQQASTAPSFHRQFWADSMWASSGPDCFVSAFFFSLVSNLLFTLMHMRLISRRGCCRGNRGGGRLASVSEIPARPLWPQDDACQSDLGGLNQISCGGLALSGSFRIQDGNIYVRAQWAVISGP